MLNMLGKVLVICKLEKNVKIPIYGKEKSKIGKKQKTAGKPVLFQKDRKEHHRPDS